MSERKVINKYYPPNFDPSKVPRREAPKSAQHTVRLMAPFSMRCNSCGEYIYKGRKFNARKETVKGETYLGVRIHRFYIRCPTCAAEITYRTDPKNADYACELGAKRNFEPWREEREAQEQSKGRRRLEEMNDPIKALENKTYDAKREMDVAEALDEIRTVNARLERVDADALVEGIRFQSNAQKAGFANFEDEEWQREFENEDEALIQKLFFQKQEEKIDSDDSTFTNAVNPAEILQLVSGGEEEKNCASCSSATLIAKTNADGDNQSRLNAKDAIAFRRAALGIVPRSKKRD